MSKEKQARSTLPPQKRIERNVLLVGCRGNQKWSVRSNFVHRLTEDYSRADSNRNSALAKGVLPGGAANDLW
jgi:hypothetical protein